MFQLLIADDEHIEREALKSIIHRNFPNSFEIIEAANGLDAVKLAKKVEPDFIFIDIKMPGQSGIEAIRQIREFLPEVDIIIITAYDYFDYAKEAISLKVSELLVKPIDVTSVISLVDLLSKQLQKKKEWKKQNFEMESTLEKVKMRYEQEFMALLQNYHISLDIIQDYLKIMDCSFAKGIAVILNFEKITADESISNIQKDFIGTRFLNKLKAQSEKLGLKCMQDRGEEDIVLLFFVLPKEMENTFQDDLQNNIIALIEENKKNSSALITYHCSNVIDQEEELPAEIYRFKQSCLGEKHAYQYPYEMEEKLIIALEKINFSEARKFISEIAKELRKQSNSELFKREAHGLYAVVRRGIKNLSKESLLPNADGLAENIKTEYDMISFFHRLFDYAENSLEQKGKKNYLLINKICDYLEEHYPEDISLEEAANRIGFSSFYFSKLMKEYCSMSYVDYVSSIRMKKAMEFFDTTDKTISEVAELVGYSDANYFTRVFKKVVGMTPSAYKEKMLR